MADMSPMMQQYLKIKKENPDSILFFRLGDFYEMFFDDAKLASEELELTLTGRDCGQEERAPMCGVPYHSCEAYIARLIKKGYRVAICEQTEDPATAKGLIDREVVRVITPGTVIEDSMLDESVGNYLASIAVLGDCGAVCFVDVSTGELHCTEFSGSGMQLRLMNELGRFMPKEIIMDKSAAAFAELESFVKSRLNVYTSVQPEGMYDNSRLKDIILKHFKRPSMDELGIKENTAALYSLGALLCYLYETQKNNLDGITAIDFYTDAQYMNLDLSTRRNLELTETIRGNDRRGSLLWVLDKTKTAMGKRLIRSWLVQPLLQPAQIIKRQNAVEEFYNDPILRDNITEILSGIFDLERLMTRIVYGTVNARELKSLEYTLSKLPALKALLEAAKSKMLTEIHNQIHDLSHIHDLIQKAIIEEPPTSLKDGGIIKEGYNKEVDRLRTDMTDGKSFIAKIEAEEKARTGIKNLRVGFNKVFGYYIEVTNSNKGQVPPEYIRKQTLTNCERYITEELKGIEGRVLGAKERLAALEYELFHEVRKSIASSLDLIQKTAGAIAKADVLCSLAAVASKEGYNKPDIGLDGVIEIKEGRHPVVETILDIPFVPNDCLLDDEANRCAIITGPNMAGKSTYMRQVAIITLMAQVGSFVPAASAHIGVVDAIFTRVGASDDLSSGQSTFMVEMKEVANIINNATRKSLLILDEIGRGTSTFDGMSIARAVLEHVTDKSKIGAKTLFATHYHELTELENSLDGVKNYNIAVKKRGDDITFLRRIVRGGADDSYGIEVAKLAGIHNNVVKRAKQILKALEDSDVNMAKANKKQKKPPVEQEDEQISFTGKAEEKLIEEIKGIDVNTLTPIEAMTRLFNLVKEAQEI